MVAQSDWLPMMIATGLAVMRALSAPRMTPKSMPPDASRGGNRFSDKDMRNKRRRGCIGIPPLLASRYVSLTLSKARWPLGTIAGSASGENELGEGREGREACRAPRARGRRRTPGSARQDGGRISAAAQRPDGARHAAGRNRAA